MRNLFTIIALLLSTHVYSQIKIMNTEVQKPKYDNFVYDSLKNMSREKYEDKYTYHHLIGQTLICCGDPYSYRAEPDSKIGNYYRVDGILPDDSGKGLYHRLSLINVDTGEKCEDRDFLQTYNFKWVVLGHYEKMKSLYVNKDFMYIGNKGFVNHHKKQDDLINLETDLVTKSVATETVWTCVDIQVKPRTKEDRMDIDKRSPIVLIFDNPQYGKHYCYLEDETGKPYKNIYEEEMPLVCGKFQLKSYYDNVKALYIAANTKRKADLTRKYGASTANLILQGKIRIGMTKNMCKDSWGEPDDINKTVTTYGTSEQWVYDDSYVYFDEKGQITAIQN